jgi:hypothetical protein
MNLSDAEFWHYFFSWDAIFERILYSLVLIRDFELKL